MFFCKSETVSPAREQRDGRWTPCAVLAYLTAVAEVACDVEEEHASARVLATAN